MILNGTKDKLVLGNLNSKRDWGHAKDYVYGMWLILQQDKPDDFVLATNKYYSIKYFVEQAFKYKNIDIKWKNSGLDEVGYDSKTNKELIFVSEKYFRASEVDELLGDYKKAKDKLGWEPKYKINDLIKEMVEHDCK